MLVEVQQSDVVADDSSTDHLEVFVDDGELYFKVVTYNSRISVDVVNAEGDLDKISGRDVLSEQDTYCCLIPERSTVKKTVIWRNILLNVLLDKIVSSCRQI